MILYTLAPLAEHLQPPEKQEYPECTCSLSGGFLHGIMTQQGFRITGIYSTDPAMYLRKENDIGTLRTDLTPKQP